jgi:hypothetical protein
MMASFVILLSFVLEHLVYSSELSLHLLNDIVIVPVEILLLIDEVCRSLLSSMEITL